MADRRTDHPRAAAPLAVVSAVLVLVVMGLARGLWLANLHNGLLALAFASVGAYVLHQRPGHRIGVLFVVTGLIEGVLFFGRQIGHAPEAQIDGWWGWLGVWPLALALASTTLSVVSFPDGRLPSARWRWVVGCVLGLAGALSLISAICPVEYQATGVRTPHPLHASTPDAVQAIWDAVAHPAYAAFQVLWVVAIAARWRSSDGAVRRQLSILVGVAALSVTALVVGLAVGGTPVPGLLTTVLLPVAAGWSVVHGQHATAYTALSWLSRESVSGDLPTGLARSTAAALAAGGARLWMGPEHRLEVIGIWPDGSASPPPASLERIADPDHVRAVRRADEVIGALSIERTAEELSAADRRLFDDLAAQAALVIEYVGLGAIIRRQRAAGHLQNLSERERQVLDLMAAGRSNAAISAELHLSIKTVEPIVSTIFTKLALHADAGSNRRVLAVLSYLQ